MTLGDLFVRQGQPRPVRLPYWVANALVFENGAIFPFAPDILEQYRVRGYIHHMAEHRYDPRRQGYHEFVDGVPLSVGMTASGKCPILIPATALTSSYDRNYPHLRLIDGGPGDNLGVLTALRKLRDRLARPELPLQTLSMGMSADLEAAVAEGATIVRIGTAIFGPRNYAKH